MPIASGRWAVAAALWDLFDHLPEPWDPHADGLDGSARNGIWTLSTQITPQFFLNIRVIVRRLIFFPPHLYPRAGGGPRWRRGLLGGLEGLAAGDDL